MQIDTGRQAGHPWDSLPPKQATETVAERRFASRCKSWLLRLAPRVVVSALARPYIAGERRQEAVSLARALHETKGLHTTLDHLGEGITDPAETKAMLAEYKAVVEDLGRCGYANISIKLSALGQALDEGLCAGNLEHLLSHAASYDQFVRFDMEDHSTTDSTLRLYRRFVGRYPRIGVVLQSRLHRTESDILELAGLKPNVRLCLGIYLEPPGIGLQDKPAMKERFLNLLEMMWENGQYVGLATHDERLIMRCLDLARRMGKKPDEYEVQMLLGVPRSEIQTHLLARGIKVRLYAPYGAHWYNYCLRRLDNNPEMARMVLGNLLRRARNL